MINLMLSMLRDKYTLTEVDVGEFSTLRASGMKFKIWAFNAEGLGHISIMSASGFFGLMKMDTVIINPKDVNLPLYSYDRIHALGNDTLIVELYRTAENLPDMSALALAKESASELPERDPGEHWYDGIKLDVSISKKGKKLDTAALDKLAERHFDAYLNLTPAEGEIGDGAEKYVEGLLELGGPSTDVFKKKLGIEKTTRLFREVLFGTAK